MPDKWSNNHVALDAPADDFVPVTPSDVADLTDTSRALYITTAGTIRVTTRGGGDRVITVGPFQILPLRVNKVWAASTTATGIWAIY